jgi:hypothetical protein
MSTGTQTGTIEGRQSPGKSPEKPSKLASQATQLAPKWAPLHPGACPASTATGAQTRAVATRTGVGSPALPGGCQGSAPTPRDEKGVR